MTTGPVSFLKNICIAEFLIAEYLNVQQAFTKNDIVIDMLIQLRNNNVYFFSVETPVLFMM